MDAFYVHLTSFKNINNLSPSFVSEFSTIVGKFAFTIFIAIGIFTYFLMTSTRAAKLINKFPQARKFPIFGTLLSLIGTPHQIPRNLGKYIERYGRCSSIWVFGKPVVILAEAERIKIILSSSKHIEKASLYDEAKWFFGNGLVIAEGKVWRQDRKLFTPMFKNQNFDGFIHTFNRYSKNLLNTLKEKFADEKEVSDLNQDIVICTLNIIIYLTTGDCKYLEGANCDKLVEIAYEVTSCIKKRITHPWYFLTFIKPFTKFPKLEKELITRLDQVTKEIIVEKNELRLTEGYEETSPLLDILLKEKPEDDIKYQIATMIGAGFETTATGIVFALFVFANYLKHQAKIHKELDEVFGSDRDRDITMDDLNKLKYLELCIKEVLRLYPPVPGIGRCATEDIDLGNGKIIPKGCDILVCIYELHRDEKVFPEPEKFQPERWLPKNKNFCENMNPYAYIPFSSGPRICIGQKYAITKMKTILSHILRNFTVSSSNCHEDLKLTYGLVIENIGGLPLKLTKRPNHVC